MKKTFLIGFKDLKLIFRDRAALTFMLLAPFLLTLGMGFVTGALSGGSTNGIEQIPLLIVNQDDGQLGLALVELFESEELADLALPTTVADPEAARLAVDADEAAAAIIIPAGFSNSIIPQAGQDSTGAVVQLEIYKNPTRPVSAGVLQSILEEFISRVETGRIGGEVVLTHLLTSGLITPDQIPELAAEMGQEQASAAWEQPAISLNAGESGETSQAFNIMAYMAPGMALLFLMFTVSNGGRSILAEQARGTLPRLLISPTGSAQILIGKIFGVYLTGVAQMLILIVTGSLLFDIQWGDPLGVLALILAAVFGATGWGLLITALARTPGQVSNVGTAIMLTFGILGGTFVNMTMLPPYFLWLSKITPNAWGLDGFTILARGGSLLELGAPMLGLFVMGTVLFLVALVFFNRRSMAQK
ncbi:MAG: ABC transporter permease [Chloroflexi bacterium]|nr:ABC transporter permease [Chloroflexota bacterium]